MSEISTHPRVRTVTAASHTESAPSAAGVLIAAVALAGLARLARAAFEACADTLAASRAASTVPAPAAQRAARLAAAPRVDALIASAGLDPLTAAQVQALVTPLAGGGAIASADAIGARVAAIVAAKDPETALRAGTELSTIVDHQNQMVFERLLLDHCAAASVAAGFERLEPAGSGETGRVVALDAAGHALVSEVCFDAAGVPTVNTEALGWSGLECQTALDHFDRALAARGVRSDPVRRRRMFGGGPLATMQASSPDRSEGDGAEPISHGGRRGYRRRGGRGLVQRGKR